MLKLLDCRPSIQYPWQLLPPETWLFSNAAHVATGRVIELEKCCWRRAHTTGGGDGAVAIATAASAAATVSGDMLRQLHLHLHPQPRSPAAALASAFEYPHIRIVASVGILHIITSQSSFWGSWRNFGYFFACFFFCSEHVRKHLNQLCSNLQRVLQHGGRRRRMRSVAAIVM